MTNLAVSLSGKTYPIVSLAGHEALSELFHFQTTILIDPNAYASVAQYLLTQAEIIFPDRDVAGVVTQITSKIIDHDTLQVQLTIEPRLALLKESHDCQVFLQQDIVDVVKAHAERVGYSLSQLIFSLEKSYSPMPYVLQVPRENDAQFLQRLLSQAGIFFWSATQQGKEMLYFADNNFACRELAQSPKEFFQPVVRAKSVPDGFAMRDYHEQKPSEMMAGVTGGKNAQHIHHQFGVGLSDQKAAQDQADIRYQAAQVNHWQLIGESTLSNLQPGYGFNLDATLWNNDDPNLSTDYLITSVSHHASQFEYRNTMCAIKRANPFRVYPLSHPALPTVFTAHSESHAGSALINEQGEYQMRQQSDCSAKAHTQASHALRRIMPHGGQPGAQGATGWHTPLHDDAELLLTTIHGHPDRPIILGALHNADKLSPVTNTNPQQHYLRTEQSSELLMDDSEKRQGLSLNTKDQLNQLAMQAIPEAHQLLLQSQQGKMQVSADHNINLHSGQDTLEQTKNNRVHWVGKSFSTQAAEKLSYLSQADQQWNAKQQVFFNAAQDIQLNSAQHVSLQSGNGLQINAPGKVAQFSGDQVGLHASGDVHIIGSGVAPISVKQGDAGFEITPDGTVNLYGSQIAIAGQSIFSTKENQTGGGGSPSSADLTNIGLIAVGVVEIVGGLLGDECGAGEAVQISGYKLTKHAVERMAERGVSKEAVEDALDNPIKINSIKIRPDGLRSQRYIGKKAEVVINPDEGSIVSTNPTETAKVNRLLRGQ